MIVGGIYFGRRIPPCLGLVEVFRYFCTQPVGIRRPIWFAHRQPIYGSRCTKNLDVVVRFNLDVGVQIKSKLNRTPTFKTLEADIQIKSDVDFHLKWKSAFKSNRVPTFRLGESRCPIQIGHRHPKGGRRYPYKIGR